MNYYERHLGDYARDTGHLSMVEHGAYTLLMDRYYATEQGIPADQAYRYARARTQEERDAVDSVLREFFVLRDGVWTKRRIEAEIDKANARISAARQNGGKGGRPKKNESDQRNEKPGGFSLGSNLETQSKALHTPDTKHQEKEKTDTGSADANPSRPTALVDAKAERLRQVTQDAVAAYNAVLGKPNGLLPAVHVVNEARLKHVSRCISTMRQICQQTYGEKTITPQAWTDLFTAVADDPFRSGRQRGGRGHENWKPDFEYLTRPDVIASVFDRAMSEGGDTTKTEAAA